MSQWHQDDKKMSRRTRRILIFGSIGVLTLTLVLLSIFVFFANNVDHRIRSISGTDLAGHSSSDYGASLLQLHSSGVFNISIVHIEQSVFIGIGTWRKSGSGLYLTYKTAEMRVGGILMRDPYDVYVGKTRRYNIQGRRIQFTIHLQDALFYF